MSVIGDLGNSDGYIYITDYDGTSVISSVINSQNNVRKIISDGVSSYPVASSGSYSSVWGHRYFLNSDPSAQPGVLTSSLEITSFIITQGLQSVRAGVSSTISSGVITPSRVSSIYLLTVDTQGGAGTDDLDTITSTGYYTGDTLYIRGANSSRVVTVKNGTGNIDLANNVDFQTGTVDNILVLQWTGSAWTEVSRSPNPAISVATLRAAGIAEPVQGVNRTTLTNGGGTINLEPGVDKGYQVYDGTVTLAGSYVIQIQPSPSTAYLDGDSMIVDYRALATVGGNTVTIFGIQLTTTQALEGRVILMAKYKLSNTTWYYTILYKAQGVDITNKAYVDATFEPYLGLPASNGFILSSDTAGNRSWIAPTTPNAVTTYNVAYVAKNGSDVTGAVQRLDLPFLTIAAARAAMIAAFPLAGRGAAGIRYLIVVFSGTYNEPIILDNLQDYDLTNATIDVQSGTGVYCIDDNNVACNSIIYGNAAITRTLAGSGGGVRTQNASTVLNLSGNYINDEVGSGIVCTNGQIIANLSNQVTSISGAALSQAAGLCSLNTYSISGQTYGVSISGGTQYINVGSNLEGVTNHAAHCTGGTQIIKGNILSYGGAYSAGTQYIYGNITCSGSISASNSGTQYIYGNVTTSADNYAALSSAGTQYIYGDVSNTNSGGTVSSSVCVTTSTGTQKVYGNITGAATDVSAYAIRHQSTSTSSEYQGDIYSAGGAGINLSSTGGIRLKSGSKVTTTLATVGAIQIPSGTPALTLESTTLISPDVSITGTVSVKVFGACQANTPVGGSVTQLVGSITVSTDVS